MYNHVQPNIVVSELWHWFHTVQLDKWKQKGSLSFYVDQDHII